MSGRPAPPLSPETRHTIWRLRKLLLDAVGGGTAFERACTAGCSESTMRRIIAGENLSIQTAARVLETRGYRLVFRLEPLNKAQDVAHDHTHTAA